LVIKRDCSYISIHFSLEIAEISLPIASSGKSCGEILADRVVGFAEKGGRQLARSQE
jgi:hypothetical protein